MKFLHYSVMQEINKGTIDEPQIEKFLQDVTVGPMSNHVFDANYAAALNEAYNGIVTVEEIEDEKEAPSQLDAIEAQVAYTAMMTDTLLEV